MAELGRRTAGRMVRNLAARFDDDLLSAEEKAFGKVDDLFASAAATHTRKIKRLPDRRVTNGYAKTVADPIVSGLTVVLSACEQVAADLVDESLTLAVDSIVAELVVCEKTLPARHRGTAETIVVDTDRIVSAQQGVFDAFNADVAATFRVKVKRVFGDDKDTLIGRLFSADPLGQQGHAGRGIWWQACSGVKAGLRDISINTSTRARAAAIDAFNTVAADA